MKKVALYVRVSTEGQAEDGYSIDAQKKLLEAWCVSREIESFEFYIDPGYSGSNIDRPGLKAMLEDARNGLLSHVAVYKLDRLSRSQKDTLYIIEDVLNKYNVGFVSLSENMDTSTPIGRAMLGILSAFAQLERETIKIRTRMGMKERVKSGLWMGGGKIPYGYDYDDERGVLVPNSDADTVKEIYRLFLEGHSPNFIALRLGLKYEKLVVQILKRITNTGVIPYKGELYSGKHEPLIDTETFERAQEEFKRRERGFLSDSPHLLSGLIYCGECSARMRYQKWGKKGYKLVCYSQQTSKPYLIHDPQCKAEKIWADDVEKEVLSDIFSLGIEKEEDPLPVKQVKESERLERKLKRLYELWSEGNDTLLRVIKELEEKLAEALKQEKLMAERESQKSEKENTIAQIKSVKDIWDTLEIRKRKVLIRSVVDKILVFKGKITVYYRF